jgi:VIT1/CCC1 family predicted Fe2+/Mn2+ transporter
MLSETEIESIAKKSLKTELQVTAIYTNLSKKYQGTEEAKLFSYFALEEENHAKFWRNFLKRRNIDSETITINRFRVSILTFIFGLLGMALTLKIFESIERNVIQYYSSMFNSESLSPEEKEDIKLFLQHEIAHEEEIGQYEAKFDFFINKIATIFTQTTGGLVLVLSTAIGLAGVYDNPLFIGISGLVVGLTGALNTVVGFFFFGRTQRTVKEDILNRIKMTYACVPLAYVGKIKSCMLKKDYDEKICQDIVDLAFEKQMVERIIAEEEYGIKEESLGNPMENALYAGLFKVVGTFLPLIPYFMGYPVSVSIPISIVITMVLLSIAGALVAIAAEVNIKSKVIELVSGGLVLATLTYILGKSASFLMNFINLG